MDHLLRFDERVCLCVDSRVIGLHSQFDLSDCTDVFSVVLLLFDEHLIDERGSTQLEVVSCLLFSQVTGSDSQD